MEEQTRRESDAPQETPTQAAPPCPPRATARRSRGSWRPTCGDRAAMTRPFEGYLTARSREDFFARPDFGLGARTATIRSRIKSATASLVICGWLWELPAAPMSVTMLVLTSKPAPS